MCWLYVYVSMRNYILWNKTFNLSELLILKATYCCFPYMFEIFKSSLEDLDTYHLLILVTDIYLTPLHDFYFFF